MNCLDSWLLSKNPTEIFNNKKCLKTCIYLLMTDVLESIDHLTAIIYWWAVDCSMAGTKLLLTLVSVSNTQIVQFLCLGIWIGFQIQWIATCQWLCMGLVSFTKMQICPESLKTSSLYFDPVFVRVCQCLQGKLSGLWVQIPKKASAQTQPLSIFMYAGVHIFILNKWNIMIEKKHHTNTLRFCQDRGNGNS